MSSKRNLITWGIVFLVIGGGVLFASKRIVCMPFSNECIFITEGDNLFNASGIKIDQTTAGVMQNLPYIVLGLGGIFLLAGLVKPDQKSE